MTMHFVALKQLLFLGGAAISVAIALFCIFKPKWLLPFFIAALGVLHIISTKYPVVIADCPFTLLDLMIWLIGAYYLAISQFSEEEDNTRQRFDTPTWAWLGMIIFSVPSLFLTSSFRDARMVMIVLFVTTRFWLHKYGDAKLLINALLVSIPVSMLAAFSQYYTNQAYLNENSNLVRSYVSSLGGANFVGAILALLYPLTLAYCSKPFSLLSAGFFGLGLVFWTAALSSLSRATPIVLALETLLAYLLLPGRRYLLIYSLLFTTCGLIAYHAIPQEWTEHWRARMQSTDLVGFYLGAPVKLGEGDLVRRDRQARFVEVITERPFGGYAATDAEDPESLPLDVALQFGWFPLLLFFSLEAFLAFRLFRMGWGGSSQGYMCRLLLIGWIGFLIYSTTTGINLCKINLLGGKFSVNANVTIYMAWFLALGWYLGSKPSDFEEIPLESSAGASAGMG
jgi:hypothetical protein